MKILIAYYSKTGRTEKLANELQKRLKEKGHIIDLEKIKVKKERSFWSWIFLRIFRGSCDVEMPEIKDVASYDVVCVGGSNWTRSAFPVIGYLKEIKGLKNKKVAFFSASTFWPQIEWYLLSVSLLDFSFSENIEKMGGRMIDSIILSSFFKRWGISSEYGEKEIKRFCQSIETPILSLKEYFLKEREVKSSRFSLTFFSTILGLSFLGQIVLSIFDLEIISWESYFYLFTIIFLVCFSIITILASKKNFYLIKYISVLALLSVLTIFVFFFTPTLGRIIVTGYILSFIFFSFFRDPKIIFFAGGVTILSYFYLYFNYPVENIFFPYLDIILLLASVAVVSFVTKNLQENYLKIIDVYEEVEMAKESLEIKIEARTRELKSMSKGLETQVKERTKELQDNIEELKRFNKLAVGRELKMIELKKEIKNLKEK